LRGPSLAVEAQVAVVVDLEPDGLPVGLVGAQFAAGRGRIGGPLAGAAAVPAQRRTAPPVFQRGGQADRQTCVVASLSNLRPMARRPPQRRRAIGGVPAAIAIFGSLRRGREGDFRPTGQRRPPTRCGSSCRDHTRKASRIFDIVRARLGRRIGSDACTARFCWRQLRGHVSEPARSHDLPAPR